MAARTNVNKIIALFMVLGQHALTGVEVMATAAASTSVGGGGGGI